MGGGGSDTIAETVLSPSPHSPSSPSTLVIVSPLRVRGNAEKSEQADGLTDLEDKARSQ